MKQFITKPLVYIDEYNGKCNLNYIFRRGDKSGVLHHKIPTNFKNIYDLKAMHNTNLPSSQINSVPLDDVYNINNQDKHKCFIFTFNHLLHYIKRYSKLGYDTDLAILNSLHLLTYAKFPSEYLNHVFCRKYKSFGRPVGKIEIYESTIASIIIGNGNHTRVEVIGQYDNKLMCVNLTSTLGNLNNNHTIVLCKRENIAIIDTTLVVNNIQSLNTRPK